MSEQSQQQRQLRSPMSPQLNQEKKKKKKKCKKKSSSAMSTTTTTSPMKKKKMTDYAKESLLRYMEGCATSNWSTSEESDDDDGYRCDEFQPSGGGVGDDQVSQPPQQPPPQQQLQQHQQQQPQYRLEFSICPYVKRKAFVHDYLPMFLEGVTLSFVELHTLETLEVQISKFLTSQLSTTKFVTLLNDADVLQAQTFVRDFFEHGRGKVRLLLEKDVQALSSSKFLTPPPPPPSTSAASMQQQQQKQFTTAITSVDESYPQDLLQSIEKLIQTDIDGDDSK